MNAAGAGMAPEASSTLGLQKPIQRQYWTGIGWSSPHARLKASFCASVIRGLLANFAVRAARSRQEDPVDDDRDAEKDRDRLDDPPDHVLRHRLTPGLGVPAWS